MKIAKNVLPLLMSRAKEVLQKFIVDDKKGGMPIARERLAEVSSILGHLKSLELDSDMELEEKSPQAIGKKKHLLKLFPLLCDCITTKENEIKQLLKEIFYTIGKELGLNE